MKAIILAAGRGTRLGPYTATTPKCLLPLGDRSLLERQLATLRGAGIEDITVVTGHGAAAIRFEGIHLRHNPDFATTNMVHSLFCAADRLVGDVVIAYGDILYEPRVLEALAAAPVSEVAVVGDTDWRVYYRARFGDPFAEAESVA